MRKRGGGGGGSTYDINLTTTVIKDSTFLNSKSECIHNKIIMKQNTNFYKEMLSIFENNTSHNITFKISPTLSGDFAITKGTNNIPYNYSISISEMLENSSDLQKELALCHELVHAYMYDTLEKNGFLTFDPDGNPLLSVSNCFSNVNYNSINLNTLNIKDRYQALFCAMDQNGSLNAQWIHEIFNTTNFNTETYRQKIENFLVQNHNWDSEEISFKNLAQTVFGQEWKAEIAKAASWIGLENTPQYVSYLNSYNLQPIKKAYIVDIRYKVQNAIKKCL